MRSLFLTLFVLVIVIPLYAQNGDNITINASEDISKLINKHIAFNKAKGGIDGYRIQIFFDAGNRSKSRSYVTKSNFILKYPNIRAYISYDAPNYKVRVGNFRTKLDAEHFRHKILEDYPASFTIPCQIDYPRLNKYEED